MHQSLQLDHQLSDLLDWRGAEPIGSRQDPREAPLKIPPPGSRAPADGGFPRLHETRKKSARGEERELCAGGARESEREREPS